MSRAWFDPARAYLRKRFRHPVPALAKRAGRPVKTCEKWMDGSSAPKGEALLALIKSDIGPDLLGVLGVRQ